MAKRKRKTDRPQPQHKKAKASQHDKRGRLTAANSQRQRTLAARFPLAGALAAAVSALAAALDARCRLRLPIIVAGLLLAEGRRTVSAWLQAAGVRDDWDRFYDCLISIGRQSSKLATAMLRQVVTQLDPGAGGRFVLAVDDTPSQRYGAHVEGAGIHHHPPPGPADGEWLYGHNYVTLALLAAHPTWGMIALGLRSLLYVRAVNVPALAAKYGWEFRTKHALAIELVLWFASTLRSWGWEREVWVVADGAYAAKPFLDPLVSAGIVAVSRLRKNAALFDLPPARKPGQRGRPRLYGDPISLQKRAAHGGGWESVTYTSRGVVVTRQVKTLVAKSHLVDGLIRVVIVRFEDGGWAPYFCTRPTATAPDILELAAARWALEEHFHDLKEVWGAGQQQVRSVWSNLGCWNLQQWVAALVELGAWNEAKATLTDRRERPWDNTDRRPSHADRRRRFALEMLRQAFPAVELPPNQTEKILTYLHSLYTLCV